MTITRTANTITTRDGTTIYFKDWGHGPAVVFSHGWPLQGDAWEDQMMFLANHGYRVIAHDRRGHGLSSKPWHGNHMNDYADDLAQLVEALCNWDQELTDNGLDIAIHRLRRKLHGSGATVRTVRGLGYLLEESADA